MKKFYAEVIREHWDENAKEKPGGGFEKTFARVCRAGVMYRWEFHPKSPLQLKAHRKEKERLKAERN